tara:strand:- start:1440 stop:2657 length:1218 start_codon:yes stop_codon:yes gene_type:complete
MSKNFELQIKFFITLLFILIICLDLFEIKDFGIDRLFYKVKPLFADLITIIPTLEELSLLGLSTKEKISSTETMNRAMNYPLLWVYIFDFLGKFTDPYKLFGYGQIFIYLFFSGKYLIKLDKNFLLISLIMFSPPILLIFDRGNNDLFIFFLVFLSIYKNNFISGFLIGLASALKVYPLFLLPFLFLFKKNKKKFLLGFLITIPIIMMSLSQLSIFLGNTATSFSSSFGILTMALFFKKIFALILNYDLPIYILVIFSLLIFILGIKILEYSFNDQINKIIHVLLNNEKNLEIFILFSLLSFFIFLSFSSWAYRIIFLLPSACVLINSLSTKFFFSNSKNFIILLLLSFPFISTWFLLTGNEILLNHYSWAFYGPIVFLSMNFYCVILINLARLKLKNFKLNFFN